MTYDIELDEKTHRYTVNGKFTPSVTQALSAAGRIDLSGIPPHILRRAALRGTRVHQAGALLLKSVLDWYTVSDAIGGYVRAIESFLHHSRFVPELETVECPLYCPEYDYCGTPDVAGNYPASRPLTAYMLHRKAGVGIRAVVDWKSGMMPGVQYQLAAYAHMLKVRHRAAVKLNSDGTYAVKWFPPETLREDFALFLQDLKTMRERGEWAA